MAGAVLLGACGHAPHATPPTGSARSVHDCSYVVEELSAQPAALEIAAHCSGRHLTGFSAADDASRPFMRLISSYPPLAETKDGWQFAAPQGEALIRYHVDLEGIAQRGRRFDTALRVGHSLIAPASTFLLEPEPLEVGVPIALTVKVPKGEDFTAGLTPSGDAGERRFELQAHEMGVATYAIFGHFRRVKWSVAGGQLEVVTADGALDSSVEQTAHWVAQSAHAVARFYGRFPASHCLVLLIPVPERDQVLFGKVLPQSSPGVAVLVGQRATEPALYQDWILVHELFHIGFPSFHDEAKWLDEGSATYFEPIIRARAGYLSELAVWTEFARDMPQGLHAIEHEGLEHPSEFRAIYWGGAIACLLADVAARQRSRGALGLEDGFRAVLAAGGNASEVWSLARVTAVIDRALGAPILAEIVAKYAQSGSAVGLAALFEELGVKRLESGAVLLDDQAPLASIRRQIVFGRD